MGRFTEFGAGTKVLLVSGPLLLVSLFLTWQATPVKFGKNGTVTQSLDGWDFWGLVIALATLAVVVLAVMLGWAPTRLLDEILDDVIAFERGRVETPA